MSRCKACDTIMTEYELKRIDVLTGHHLDLCNVCSSYSNDAITQLGDTYVAESEQLSEKELDDILNRGYNT
jgi:hypothetical protein